MIHHRQESVEFVPQTLFSIVWIKQVVKEASNESNLGDGTLYENGLDKF